MKIAISGAHCVGKTTLAETLVEALPEYEYRPEPYYELTETGYTFAEIPGPDDYLAQLEYSIKQISSADAHIIFDRCPLDFLAYLHAIGEEATAVSLDDQVQKALSAIDLLVFVPFEEPDRVHCPESELPELRLAVNKLLSDRISELDITILTVSGSLDERKKQVLNRIKGI